MSNRRFNNKLLFGLLGALVLVFYISNYFKEKKINQNSLPEFLTKIDAKNVTAISISNPSSNKDVISFTNTSSEDWQVHSSSKNITAQASKVAMSQLIEQLSNIKPKKLLTKSKDQWENYGITDSLAVKLTINQKESSPIDIYIGKLDQDADTPLNQNRKPSAISYLRIGQQEYVYAIKGFFSVSVKRGFDAWRDARVTQLDPSKVTSIKFQYKKNEDFELIKKDTLWYVDSTKADLKRVKKYLEDLKDKKEHGFVDDFTLTSDFDYKVVLAGESMSSIDLKCWIKDSGDYILNSSTNPKAYFKISPKNIFKDIFFRKKDFL